MKKLISAALCAVLVLSLFCASGCSKKSNDDTDNTEPLKLGLGVHSYSDNATNAEGELNGKGQLTVTAAAVLVNADGKIVKCVIDTAECIAEYTSEGKYIPSKDFKTKYELGDSYGMKSIAGSQKEWFEQIDALTSLVAGKTLTEIGALVTESGKGNDDVISAGCTINVSDFILALEKAVKSASNSDANASSSLQLKISTSQSGKDAATNANGYNELKSNITVTALDKDGRSIASRDNTAEATYYFNSNGEVKKAENN